MSVEQLPSGNWRARAYDPAVGREVKVRDVLPNEPVTYPSERAATAGKHRALEAIKQRGELGPTLAEWHETYTTDPRWIGGLKEATIIHREERTRGFVREYGHRRLSELNVPAVGDEIARGWVRRYPGTVGKICAMLNAAQTYEAGRLMDFNPFTGLHKLSKGNGEVQPPDEQEAARLVFAGYNLKPNPAPRDFCEWLRFAQGTGMRPGEIDGAAIEQIDWDAGLVWVDRQWSATARKITTPKNGRSRWAMLTPMAMAALEAVGARERDPSEPIFQNTRGGAWRPSARAPYWKAVQAQAGEGRSLYLCTRHFAGWYMVNVLLLMPEDIAEALGHRDGGTLVRRVYGHRGHKESVMRARDAWAARPPTVDEHLLRELEAEAV